MQENTQEIKQVSIGQEVPDFHFEIYHKGKDSKSKISDYSGKWLILFFYPGDFTFVCPTELEDMALHHEAFKKEGAEILSVSTDTVFVHKAWHDTSPSIKKIEFPMAADPTGKLCKTFGTYIEGDIASLVKDEGMSLRGSFIIDPKGVLRCIEINSNGIGRNSGELLRKLQAAKFVHEHGDQVCPANWHPGDDTFTPGMDLVGKI